jgi:hypothetical protein
VVSEQLVRLQLAQEAEEGDRELDMGMQGSLADNHPSVVILNGLRLEDDQYESFPLASHYLLLIEPPQAATCRGFERVGLAPDIQASCHVS